MTARRSGRSRGELKVTQNLIFFVLGMALFGIPAVWFGIAIIVAWIRA